MAEDTHVLVELTPFSLHALRAVNGVVEAGGECALENKVALVTGGASGIGLAIISEVTEAVLPDREASDANFRLLLLTAQAVKRTGKWEVPLAYFALWTVKLGGWLPPLDACSRCGTVLTASEPAYFSRSSSALVCGKCRKPGLRRIPAPALVAARKMLAERLDRLSDADISNAAARELTEVALDVIERQIDRKLKSRALLEPTA